MRTGRLHRYNLQSNKESQASLLEAEFAKWQGVNFCLACTSGGYAIQLALRACGVEIGEKVLANAYTLAPVPGAIHNVRAIPAIVEIDEHYHIDLEDLVKKSKESDAKYLLLSHMSGHIADMDKIVSLYNDNGISIIEDCDHTMGFKWNGIRSGNFGLVSAFSRQTYRHVNSGERYSLLLMILNLQPELSFRPGLTRFMAGMAQYPLRRYLGSEIVFSKLFGKNGSNKAKFTTRSDTKFRE